MSKDLTQSPKWSTTIQLSKSGEGALNLYVEYFSTLPCEMPGSKSWLRREDRQTWKPGDRKLVFGGKTFLRNVFWMCSSCSRLPFLSFLFLFFFFFSLLFSFAFTTKKYHKFQWLSERNAMLASRWWMDIQILTRWSIGDEFCGWEPQWENQCDLGFLQVRLRVRELLPLLAEHLHRSAFSIHRTHFWMEILTSSKYT